MMLMTHFFISIIITNRLDRTHSLSKTELRSQFCQRLWQFYSCILSVLSQSIRNCGLPFWQDHIPYSWFSAGACHQPRPIRLTNTCRCRKSQLPPTTPASSGQYTLVPTFAWPGLLSSLASQTCGVGCSFLFSSLWSLSCFGDAELISFQAGWERCLLMDQRFGLVCLRCSLVVCHLNCPLKDWPSSLEVVSGILMVASWQLQQLAVEQIHPEPRSFPRYYTILARCRFHWFHWIASILLCICSSRICCGSSFDLEGPYTRKQPECMLTLQRSL